MCCQLIQPWAFLVALGSLIAQIARMHYEEQVLAETFPSYRAYMSRQRDCCLGSTEQRRHGTVET
jgi:protein-S-isoprenylcysteine O-methyltransferase Ste14